MELEEKINQIKQAYCDAFSAFKESSGGYSHWYYDLDEMTLELVNGNKKETFSIIPVGTYSTEYHSFLWSWANDDLPENTRSQAAKLKLLHSEFPFKALIQNGFKCSQNELDEILALSLYKLKGKVIFKIKDQEPWLFLCVF